MGWGFGRAFADVASGVRDPRQGHSGMTGGGVVNIMVESLNDLIGSRCN
jgi:hypothetical protein